MCTSDLLAYIQINDSMNGGTKKKKILNVFEFREAGETSLQLPLSISVTAFVIGSPYQSLKYVTLIANPNGGDFRKPPNKTGERKLVLCDCEVPVQTMTKHCKMCTVLHSERS